MNKHIVIADNIKPDCLMIVPDYVYIKDFDEEGYKKFKEDFNKVLNANRTIIPIVIDSYGGYVHSLMGMVSIIKNSPIPVATILETKAMSCGAVLFSCGTKGLRFMSPYASMMIHEVSSGDYGKLKDIQTSAEHSADLNDVLFQILDENSGKEKGFFKEQINKRQNTDWYINPKAAKKLGLVDHIKIPDLQIVVAQGVSLV
jgi:ATP-dependent Clp endopeptidase proteolytic subunit ClpP